ncbi:MAG: DUF1330 domain-containing protein [Planctomycetota bacterium]|nr:DUF1330 domain-containing protein [Planctomycetota bacterium]
MSYELLVGIEVTDDERYQAYREAMLPILERHGGGFRYDFKVDQVLRNDSGEPINRVFTIHFDDEEAKVRFFDHPDYLKIKATYFESSVGAVTIMAEYDRPAESA